MLRFFEDLLVSLRKGRPMAGIDVARAMQGRSLTIVPCLNPDGVEIALNQDHGALHFQNEVRKISGGHYENWQANGRGVDLQYNFDAGWQAARRLQAEAGICGPAPAGFSGNSPMSEPESRAAVNLCKTFDVAKLFTFHTPGEEIRYSYGENTPIRSRLMVEVLAGACGYAVREPGNSDIPASMKDWFIHQTGRPAFAVHAGRESGLPAAGDLPLVYARLAEMMLLAVFI
jgi:g-D-glutamyl-meso-diaminopimelate peptidase